MTPAQKERTFKPIRRKTWTQFKKQAKKRGIKCIDYMDFLVENDAKVIHS